MLKAGLYILTEDVKNPKPDKRTRRSLPHMDVWEKGTCFQCSHINLPPLEKDGGFFELSVKGARGRILIPNGDEAEWSFLIDKLVMPPANLGNMLSDLEARVPYGSVSVMGVLAVLLDLEKITLKDVEVAALAYNRLTDDDALYEEFWKRHGRGSLADTY